MTLGGSSGLLEEVEPVRADVTRVGIEKIPDEKEGEPVTLGGAVDFTPKVGEVLEMPGRPDALSWPGVDGGAVSVGELSLEGRNPGDGSISLKEAAMEASPADAWFRDGDMAGLCRVMPLSEFAAWQDVLSFDGAITLAERPDGGVDFTCSPTAPEAVQRTAAHAQQTGEIGEDDAKAMVANITLDTVANHPEATVDHILEQFKDSGVFEALGAGDVNVGKERTRAIVAEFVARSGSYTKRLSTDSIKRLIDLHVDSPAFFEGKEWYVVSQLQRMAGVENSEWDYDDSYGKFWNQGYHIYKKYRKQYRPEAEGELTDEEWKKNAPAFFKWYKEEVYGKLKEADTKAACDWYAARIAEELQGRIEVGKGAEAGYKGGYASDVAVVRSVLEKDHPLSGAVEAMLDSLAKQEKQAFERSSAIRKKAERHYARLREMKQVFKENSEKAQREKKRAEEKESRERENAEKQLAARKLAVARRQPRQQAWAWDRKPSADGESPACTVPEEEYRRLVEELGWDGSQDVYLRVAGASIQVVGANRRKRLELNAPAVLKVQKRPNAKRGEKWKLQGDLGYSYIFKTYAN